MTAASELKSAAVVQEQARNESRKRKTPGQTAVEVTSAVAVTAASKDLAEVRNEVARKEVARKEIARTVEQVQAANGSTTAGATQMVAAAHETSGSSAATASKAASIQATSLPVSVFSRIRESSQLTRIQYRCGLEGRGVRRVQIMPGARAVQAYR